MVNNTWMPNFDQLEIRDPLKSSVFLCFQEHKIEKLTRDGLTLNGISDAGSNSGFLVFPVGIKWENWPEMSSSKNLKELNKILWSSIKFQIKVIRS